MTISLREDGEPDPSAAPFGIELVGYPLVHFHLGTIAHLAKTTN